MKTVEDPMLAHDGKDALCPLLLLQRGLLLGAFRFLRFKLASARVLLVRRVPWPFSQFGPPWVALQG